MKPTNLFLLSYMASVIFLIGACAKTSSNSENKIVKKPNVIMILSDDQGWGDLSMNGNVSLSTPNIDRLASSGASFDRFYVSPVCSPTRAEMLTGRYHVRSGVSGTSAGKERLDLDETTIAEVFKTAGYATAAYGKWHNGMQAPYHPNTRGFDDFFGFCSGHWGNYFEPMLEENGEITKGDGFIVDDLTQHGLDFIDMNQDNPFFLYLPFNTPHSPMQVPDRFWNKFQDMEISQTGTRGDREEILHTKAALAMCENIDWNVGRILEKLEALDLAEQTMVIYFSDNGPNGHRWNGEMKGIKGSTDEGGVRSPLIINWPGMLKPGLSVGQISSAIDLLPTLTALANIPCKTNNEVDGVSLKPLLFSNSSEWEERYLFHYWNKKLSIRSQEYRLDHEGRLYDMVNDPNQQREITDNKPAIFATLNSAKTQWAGQVLVELPEVDQRSFVIGHPGLEVTQVPARDGIPSGNIKRSNRFPNDSYFYNWSNVDDLISWPVEVALSGNFEVELYYTCPKNDVGATIKLSFGADHLLGQVMEAHDPPVIGKEEDRFLRQESYVKDFKPMKLGKIHLEKGVGTLQLQAIQIPGDQAIEFRLLTLRRV